MDPVTTGGGIAVLWAGKKIFGKTLDAIGGDISSLYEKGRNKIIEKAQSKIENIDDGKTANLRVSRDVLWNGSFSDDDVCSEYFGGVLAASRTDIGSDDGAVFYVDIIKSLSSNQLKLHYLIYNAIQASLNKTKDHENLNPGMESELQSINVYMLATEIIRLSPEMDLGIDLHALSSKGLIARWMVDVKNVEIHGNQNTVSYLKVSPTALGVQLYAVAHNKKEKWRYFSRENFGDFTSIPKIQIYFNNEQDLEKSLELSPSFLQAK